MRRLSLTSSLLQVLQFASALCREGGEQQCRTEVLVPLLSWYIEHTIQKLLQSGAGFISLRVTLYYPLTWVNSAAILLGFGFISEAHSSHCVTAVMSATKASQVPAQASWPFHVFLCWPRWVGWGISVNHSFWAVCIFLYQMSDNEMKTLYWTFYLVCSFSNLPNILVSSGKWCFGGCHRCQTLIKSTLSC